MAGGLARRIGRRLADIVVLDESALIALLSSEDPHHDWAVQMFIDTVAWNYQITALNKAEAMVHPTRLGKLDGFLASLEGLRVEVAAIEDADTAEISKIKATTNLKMPDATVLYQAEKAQGAIATTDTELARVAQSRSVGVFRPS